jgi:ceramide glucosyltransferase
MIGVALSAIVLAWSGGLASTAIWAAVRSTRPPRRGQARTESAILIRPCAGDEPSLSRALASTEHAQGASTLRIRFAVASRDDKASVLAERASAALRDRGMDAATVVTGAIGPNRKTDQLARTLACESSCTRIVIVADSDVDLEDVPLDELTAPLAEERVAAVWAAPVEIAPRTLGDRASAAVLDASLHSFPLLAALDPAGMVGKLFAIRREALDEVGGFGALVEHLGEDMELARRLHAAGWRTRLAPVLAPSLAHGRSWDQVVQRYARWVTVIRAQRPHLLWTYPGVMFATLLVLSLGLLSASVGGPHALVGVVVAVSSRVFVGCLARVRSGRPLRPHYLPRDIVLADLLLALAFIRALCSRRVVWRGVELRPDERTGTLASGAP